MRSSMENEQAIPGPGRKWLAATGKGDLPTVLNLMAHGAIFMISRRNPRGGAQSMKDVEIADTALLQRK